MGSLKISNYHIENNPREHVGNIKVYVFPLLSVASLVVSNFFKYENYITIKT